ncbi:hypothetical protein EC957_003317 [Mortierella hygrophila]|uniref:Uncharacterized protein n=1 Tax=Mortierella hygrophila TaxID=979708 RepID=A0A9P6K153_9FUNG|nr:hypothetical protein EC957_003317 [Mortierella hygrophila]
MAYKPNYKDYLFRLSKTSFEVADLIKEYESEANNHSNGSVTAKIVSTSLAVTGAVAGAGLAVMVPPMAAIGTFVLLAGGSGGISGFISLYDQRKSDIYTTAAAKLNIVQGCSKEFQAPISAIYTKLPRNKQFLQYIKNDTSTATSDNQPDIIRHDSYMAARKEAGRIMQVCSEISQYALDITILNGQVTSRLSQSQITQN